MEPHPFDPITPNEISQTVKLLRRNFEGTQLRFKLIDVNEPIKIDVIPFLEAERLGQKLPPSPTRLIQALFHSKFPRVLYLYLHAFLGLAKLKLAELLGLDTGVFYKALLNIRADKVVLLKSLPKEVQVSTR